MHAQEPWAEEDFGSYQIMTAVQLQGYRPQLPALDQLPGQVGGVCRQGECIQPVQHASGKGKAKS